jgi:hypothetical protein
MRPPFVCLAASLVLLTIAATGCGRPERSIHTAKVTEARHPTLFGGERCQVQVSEAYKFGLNCRINVMCDGHQLYGGKRLGGYAVCALGDSGTARSSLEDQLSTKDGDPAIALDVDKGTVRVWDEGWSVSAALIDGAPGARAAGTAVAAGR